MKTAGPAASFQNIKRDIHKSITVFYTPGIVHAVRCTESVLLITLTIKDVPSDAQSYRFIEYAGIARSETDALYHGFFDPVFSFRIEST